MAEEKNTMTAEVEDVTSATETPEVKNEIQTINPNNILHL